MGCPTAARHSIAAALLAAVISACSPPPYGGGDAGSTDAAVFADAGGDAGWDAGTRDAGVPCSGACGPREYCKEESDRCEVQCVSCQSDSDCADGGRCEREEALAGGFCVFPADADECFVASRRSLVISVFASSFGCERAPGSYECVWRVAVDLDAGIAIPSFRATEFSATSPEIDETYAPIALTTAVTDAWLTPRGALDVCMAQPTFESAGDLCRTHDVLVALDVALLDGGVGGTSYNVGTGRRPDLRVFEAIAETLRATAASWPDGGQLPYAP